MIMLPAIGSALSARLWLSDPEGSFAQGKGGGLPFPPDVPRMYASQKAAVARTAAAAINHSAAATAPLLAHLNSTAFRASLQACCSRSGLAHASAEEVLAKLREALYTAELVHNFDGVWETDATIEIGLHNATSYFPSTWMLRYNEYYGPRFNPRFGQPASPEPSGEEGVFRLPPFHGPHDEPLSFAAASSRLLYVALNLLRVDVGNPGFGNVTAVFSPSFWTDAVVAAPVDTGLWTMACNETYRALPGARAMRVPLACHGGGQEVPAGVAGWMDHVLLNNARLWAPIGSDTLGRAVARNFGDDDDDDDADADADADGSRGRYDGHAGSRGRYDSQTGNVSSDETSLYIEPNILANALYSERSVKMLVGSFAALFGTPRGALLQAWAARQRIALTWGLGTGLVSNSHHHHPHGGKGGAESSFAGDRRLVDVPSSAAAMLNASLASAADVRVFRKLWADVAEARAAAVAADLNQSQVWGLWTRATRELSPPLQLALPRVGDCSGEWERCLGRGGAGRGECICYDRAWSLSSRGGDGGDGDQREARVASGGASAGPPPGIHLTNGVDGDDLFNVTTGAPGSCSCESPKCEEGVGGMVVPYGETRAYGPAGGCNYYAIGGGITSKRDGYVCNTWRADYKSCAVYPGSTAGDCGRLITPTCTMAGTATTIKAGVDRKCNTLQWKSCNSTSICCGSNECKLINPGKSKEMLCQPS
jgi:hypothetical protein